MCDDMAAQRDEALCSLQFHHLNHPLRSRELRATRRARAGHRCTKTFYELCVTLLEPALMVRVRGRYVATSNRTQLQHWRRLRIMHQISSLLRQRRL